MTMLKTLHGTDEAGMRNLTVLLVPYHHYNFPSQKLRNLRFQLFLSWVFFTSPKCHTKQLTLMS